MGFHVVRPNDLAWTERDRQPEEAPRWHAPVTGPLELGRSRARMWRYSAGAKGRRHKDPAQEEVFVVIEGAMTAYLGDPPERVDLPPGSVLAVHPGTAIQLRNESDGDARLFIYGAPPEDGDVEFLPDAE
jgi:quercetin dioxygenase-like cupin family protein